VWAAWNVSTNYGGLQFLSPDAEISSSLPTGLVGNNGMLTLTNIYTEQAQLSLVLYGTNVTDGSVLWRTVTVTPVLNDSIQVTNLASQVTTLSNGWVSVDFTFTATSREGLPAIYNWIIEQGGKHVFWHRNDRDKSGAAKFPDRSGWGHHTHDFRRVRWGRLLYCAGHRAVRSLHRPLFVLSGSGQPSPA